MRLERLVVGGFGCLPAGSELELEPGLNLILAPNEGGKTTLARFITGMFYGFGRRRGGSHPYQPWSGGQVGGELSYRLDSGGVFTIHRHLVKQGEKLTLRDHEGQEVKRGKRQPGELHLGLSRGAFITVSRVELDDLQGAFSGRGKDGSQARQELKGFFFQEAATRGELANPVEVRESWQEKAASLYSRDRRRGREDQALVGELEQAEQELARALAEQEEARELMTELKSLAVRIQEAEAALARANRALEQAHKARRRGELLKRRQGLQEEMARLSAQGLADEATRQRARDLEKEASRLRAEAQESRARSPQPPAGPVLPVEELAALGRRLLVLEERRQGLERRQEKLAGEEAALREAWGREPGELARLDPGLPERLEAARRALARAQEEEGTRQERLQALAARPATPAWAWPLGLAGLGLGLVLLAAWWAGAPLAWAAQGGAAAILAGGGLALWGRVCRRRQERRLAARRELDQARELVEAARRELESIGASLGPELARAPLSELAAALARARDLVADRRSLAGEQEGLDAEWAELLGDIQARGAAPGEEPRAALDRLRRQAEAADRAREEAGRREQKARAMEARAGQCRRELEQLLRDAGLADLAALDRAARRSRRMQELAAQLAELDRQLGESPREGESSDARALARAQERAEQELAQCQAGLRRLEARRGRLQERLDHLQGRPQATRIQAHKQELERRCRDPALRHTLLLFAGAPFQRAMDQFRLESQPQLLLRAARYLERASAGAYKWLGSDLFHPGAAKEPRISARRDRGRAEREAEELSRGTRDLLYLCLRLALADEITEQGQSVPLILDDPLVNMDDTRLRAGLELLAELAGERQVLLMTCHQQQAEMLARITPCRPLPLG